MTTNKSAAGNETSGSLPDAPAFNEQALNKEDFERVEKIGVSVANPVIIRTALRIAARALDREGMAHSIISTTQIPGEHPWDHAVRAVQSFLTGDKQP